MSGISTGDASVLATTSTPKTIWTSIGRWDNGHSRTITGHEEFDPDDETLFFGAGENRKLVIDGNGNAIQSGARSRMYILAPNYNAQMEVTFVMNSSLDNLSLKLRSRHQEGGSTTNKFGGYGIAIFHNEVEFNRENYHDGGHPKFGQPSFSPAFVNGQTYTIRATVKDDNNGDVLLIFEVLENGQWVQKATGKDTNPESNMVDKALYLEDTSTVYGYSSYAWVRTNGDAPKDVVIKKVTIRDLDTLVPNPNPDPNDPDPTPDPDPDPDPTTPSCPTNWHWDATINQCVRNVPSSESRYDNYGIQKQYVSKFDDIVQHWITDCCPETDPQFESIEETILTENDYFVVRNVTPPTQIGLSINSVDGVPAGNCSVSYTALKIQDFRHTNRDFKNTESTIFLKPESVHDLANGYFEMTARESTGGSTSNCCDSYKYFARIYFDNSGSNKGKVQIGKTLANNHTATSLLFSQSLKDNFYQSWTGFKFVVYNFTDDQNQTRVRLELWMCVNDSITNMANNWTRIATYMDTGTLDTLNGGLCTGASNEVITWGSHKQSIYFTGSDIRFKFWSIREIDVTKEWTEDPIICPTGEVWNPVTKQCVKTGTNPPQEPVPQIPAAFKRSITFSRNIINNADCKCVGIDPNTNTGGGGGNNGGGGQYVAIYDVSPNDSRYDRMASVDHDEDDYYLKYRQKFDRDNSVFIGQTIKIIKVFLAEDNSPDGDVYVRIVDKDGNEKVSFGTISTQEIQDKGAWFVRQNLENQYKCQKNDAIEFAYDKGSRKHHVRIFRKRNTPKTGSKIYRLDNDSSRFDDIDYDIVMRVEVLKK